MNLIKLVVSLLFILTLRSSACRWALYAGSAPEQGDALFISPKLALVRQSYEPPLFKDEATKALYFDESKFHIRNHNVNKDGWGVGWYSSHSGQAKRYRDAEGATDEDNAANPDVAGITHGIRSQVILAHIRAATTGLHSFSNSHPFRFRQILWMHHGGIPHAVQKELEGAMNCSAVKQLVNGQTDSEHLGGYFASSLNNGACSRDVFTLEELQAGMKDTIRTVEKFEGENHSSSLNFAVSDGRHVVVTRYRTNRTEDPPSLYYSKSKGALWVASEPLDGDMSGIYKGESRTWLPLSKDEMLSYVVETDTLHLECLSSACYVDRQHRILNLRNDL